MITKIIGLILMIATIPTILILNRYLNFTEDENVALGFQGFILIIIGFILVEPVERLKKAFKVYCG